MVSLDESYKRCEAVTKARARNFYYGIRLLPEERRKSLCAVYAFFRRCDDIVDGSVDGDRKQLLARWRSSIEPESDVDDPILPAFYDTIRKFDIPKRYFGELLDGVESDLRVRRYKNFSELYRYCYQVASTVGIVCIHIFGFDGSKQALQEAEYRGIAFQLTNILRDISEDASNGRVYLPLEDLEKFKVSIDALTAGQPEQGFKSLLEFEVERARKYYELSAPLSEKVAKESRPALEGMTRIYRGLLEKIAVMGEEILKTKPCLSKLEKVKVFLLASLKG